MEIVALRHQLGVYQRSVRRPLIKLEDRVIWSWIAPRWLGYKEALSIVQPRTVMAWQKKRFRAHWAKLSHAGKSGRPALSKEGRALTVTEHPTSQWTAQQIVETFPWDAAPKYLLHDRDKVYGTGYRKRVRSLDIEEILTAPRSPWQSPYVERYYFQKVLQVIHPIPESLERGF